MDIQLGVIEARYADMIWEHEPVTSSELVKMTAAEFNWKRTTLIASNPIFISLSFSSFK